MDNKEIEKSKYYAIRVHKGDFEELSKISEETFIPMCRLLKLAIPLLKKKLKIKDEVDNGGSKL